MIKPLACIIVDDPPLTKRYGFIDLHKFLGWLKAVDLAATFAFIPWNYRRTDRNIANLFISNPDRLSICVHGCNHTEAEFASHDRRYLDGICALARYRMIEHERTYGLPWDNAVVFPQGKFSPESMVSLREAGFIAAVNSIDSLCSYDLSKPFVNEFGFPLITRRYPKSVDEFVADASVGKPILITQHHWDFAEGFAPLTEFIQSLKSRIPGLQWKPLGAILSEIGLKSGSKPVAKHFRLPLTDELKIASRRYLCELRDNYLQPLKRILSNHFRSSVSKDAH